MEDDQQIEEVEIEEVDSTPTDEETTQEPVEGEAQEGEDQEDEQPKKKSKGGFQRRIDELTRQRYEEQQRREQLEQQLREYQQKLQQTEIDGAKPTLEQYGYDGEAYAQALDQWYAQKQEQEQRSRQEQEQARQQQEQQIRQQVEMQRKVSEAQAKYPDFMDKVNDPSLPSLAQINQTAYQALTESDQMADVAYYLASNPSEVYKFQSLSPLQAVKEIARLEMKLGQKPKQQSKAPPPAQPVSGKSDASTGLDADISTEEWMARRMKQLNQG